MTVKEFIEKLEEYDDNLEISIYESYQGNKYKRVNMWPHENLLIIEINETMEEWG